MTFPRILTLSIVLTLLSCQTGPRIPDEFILIKSGTFTMGDASDRKIRLHEVTLTRDFFLMKHEVTLKDYQTLMKEDVP